MSYNIQEQEEIDFQFGPRIWDADPDVCCAYFQTGACEHSEGGYYDEIDAIDVPIVTFPRGFADAVWFQTHDEEPF